MIGILNSMLINWTYIHVHVVHRCFSVSPVLRSSLRGWLSAGVSNSTSVRGGGYGLTGVPVSPRQLVCPG